MNALVIYESFFGNTRQIAEAVARGLAIRFETIAAEVGESGPAMDGARLVVLGGPTHAFSMTREGSREDARKQAAEKGITAPSERDGIRELIERLPTTRGKSDDPLFATFDTVIKKGFWLPTGSAAGSAAKRIKKKGYELAIDPEQFHVSGTDGPLLEGEVERAEQWGKKLAEETAIWLAPFDAAVSG